MEAKVGVDLNPVSVNIGHIGFVTIHLFLCIAVVGRLFAVRYECDRIVQRNCIVPMEAVLIARRIFITISRRNHPVVGTAGNPVPHRHHEVVSSVRHGIIAACRIFRIGVSIARIVIHPVVVSNRHVKEVVFIN